jgi:hypothetical protein
MTQGIYVGIVIWVRVHSGIYGLRASVVKAPSKPNDKQLAQPRQQGFNGPIPRQGEPFNKNSHRFIHFS